MFLALSGDPAIAPAAVLIPRWWRQGQSRAKTPVVAVVDMVGGRRRQLRRGDSHGKRRRFAHHSHAAVSVSGRTALWVGQCTCRRRPCHRRHRRRWPSLSLPPRPSTWRPSWWRVLRGPPVGRSSTAISTTRSSVWCTATITPPPTPPPPTTTTPLIRRRRRRCRCPRRLRQVSYRPSKRGNGWPTYDARTVYSPLPSPVPRIRTPS